MKHRLHLVALCAAAAFLGGALVSAQGPGHHKGMRMYDPKTEQTFKGTVEAVTQGAGGHGMGMHLTVKTADGVQEVMLGPAQFIADKQFTFAKGDSVEVTGSKVTMGRSESVVAREVIKDGKTLTLRDKSGRPEWSGMGMGMGRKKPAQ
jgi:hypothetical protein